MLVLVVILAIALLFANGLTKRMIRPINAINLEDPLSNDTYDELSPLLSRIEKQNRQLHAQMEELTEKQNEFTAISGNMSEGMILLDTNACVISINDSAIRLLGAPRQAYIGAHILTLSREPKTSAAVEKALNGEAGECILQKNGRYCEMMANPVLDGKAVRGVVVLLFRCDGKA